MKKSSTETMVNGEPDIISDRQHKKKKKVTINADSETVEVKSLKKKKNKEEGEPILAEASEEIEPTTSGKKKRKRKKKNNNASTLLSGHTELANDITTNLSKSSATIKSKKRRRKDSEISTLNEEETERHQEPRHEEQMEVDLDFRQDMQQDINYKETDDALQFNGRPLKDFLPSNFSVQDFRKSIKFGDAGLELLRFSAMLVYKPDDRDAVAEYLDAGGSAAEILSAMSRCQDASHSNALAALKILQNIFLRSLTDYPILLADSEESALRLLHSSLPFIHSLLSLKSLTSRLKAVIKLLTAMVSLSPRVAKEVLRQVIFSREIIRRLTSPSTHDDIQVSLRTAYLHFLLAFLVDGDSSLIHLLMAQNGMLSTAMLGLNRDPAHVIHLVLTTLRIKVLENPDVTKSHKQRTFNTRVLESLVLLYSWQGPRASNSTYHNKYKRKYVPQEIVDPDDLKMVQEAVHSFLTLLLTSHKLGIVFANQSDFAHSSNHNYQAFTLLRRLKKPWESALQTDLVISALRACPNLLKMTLAIFVDMLVPRATSAWISAMEFIIKVLENMQLTDVLRGLKEQSPSVRSLTAAIESITLPITLLQAVTSKGMTHKHGSVRKTTARLLSCVLGCLQRHLSYVSTSKMLPTSGVDSVKSLISTRLTQSFASISLVWSAWKEVLNTVEPIGNIQSNTIEDYFELEISEMENKIEEIKSIPNITMLKERSIIPMNLLTPANFTTAKITPAKNTSDPTTMEEPSHSSQYATLLELLLGYQFWLPHWVEGDSGMNPEDLLNSIKMAAKHLKSSEESNKMAVRAISLLASFDGMVISPNQELFSWAVYCLVNQCITYPNSEVGVMAKSALDQLLARNGLLQENIYELDTWLSCLQLIDDEFDKKKAGVLFMKGLILLAQKLAEYSDVLMALCWLESEDGEVPGSHAEQLVAMLEEMATELSMPSTKCDPQPHLPSNQGLSFSPLFLAALEHFTPTRKKKRNFTLLKSINTVHYFGNVTMRLLHHQTNIKPFLQLTFEHLECLPTEVAEYLKGWKNNVFPELPKNTLSKEEQELYRYLTCKEKKDLTELSPDLDDLTVHQLFHTVTFYLSQMITQKSVTEELSETVWTAMEWVLTCARVKVEQGTSKNLLSECLGIALNHPVVLEEFQIKMKSSHTSRHVTDLVLHLILFASNELKSDNVLRNLVGRLRQKTLHQIISKFGSSKLKSASKVKLLSWRGSGEVILLLSHLQLNKEEMTCVLNAVYKLDPVLWLNSTASGLGDIGQIATFIIQRVADQRANLPPNSRNVSANLAMDPELWNTFMSFYCRLISDTGADANLEDIERAIFSYLQNYPHHMENLPSGLMVSLLIRCSTYPSSLQLAGLVLSRDPRQVPTFESWAMQATKQSGPLLSLIWWAVEKDPNALDHEFLKSIFKGIASDYIASMLLMSHHSTFFDATHPVMCYLFDNFLKTKVATKHASKLLEAVKLESISSAHADLIFRVIFKSGFEHSTILMRQMINALTVLMSNPTYDTKLASTICLELTKYFRADEVDLTAVCDEDGWFPFSQQALKTGIGGDEQLLECIIALFRHWKCTKSADKQLEEVFEMMVSHSQFIPMLLGNNKEQKELLLRLHAALVKLKPSLMNMKHVPVLLGAYQASLSITDQIILKLLQDYESNGVSLNDFRPLLWGEAAVTRYALRSQVGLSLLSQPTVGQVLRLLETKRVESTVYRFPLSRGLCVETFEKPDECVYDPTFMLPLFTQLLAAESLVQPWLFQREALPIVLIALASNNPEMRSIAQLAIARLHFHMETGRLTVEKKLWLRFLDTVRLTLSVEGEDVAKLPPLIGVFLAQASMEMSCPENTLYGVLHSYLLVKPSLNLNSVPNLLRMLHSSETNHSDHTRWILGVIVNGLRTEEDFTICNNSYLYKLLMCLYSSHLANNDNKDEILRVLESTLDIPRATWRLVTSYGLLSWLYGAVNQFQRPGHGENSWQLQLSFISMLRRLWQSAKNLPQDKDEPSAGFLHLVLPSLFQTLLSLLYKLPRRIPSPNLSSFVITLHCIYQDYSMTKNAPILQEGDLKHILSLAHNSVEHLEDCEDYLKFGCKFVGKPCKIDGTDESVIKHHLQSVIKLWFKENEVVMEIK